MTFRRIADATEDDWAAIGVAQSTRRHREYAWAIRLFASLHDIRDGFACTQAHHSLQVAGRLEAAGASEELVLAGLLHDVAKPLSLVNHPAIAAEMLGEYVSEDTADIIRWHGHFLADETHGRAGRELFRDEPWFADAVLFARIDSESFDPEYPVKTLEHYLPRLRKLYRLK
jgi:predicted HD phosphohydrolase